MPTKYYIVPAESPETAQSMGMTICPKYLVEFRQHNAGVIPANDANGKYTATDQIHKYKEPYYIIAAHGETDQAMIALKPDVVEINKDTETTRLSSIGVDVSKVPASSINPERRNEIDKAVTLWLINEEKILSEIITPINGTILASR